MLENFASREDRAVFHTLGSGKTAKLFTISHYSEKD